MVKKHIQVYMRYVSFKTRKNSNNIFGFVRLSSKIEEKKAISNLNGKELNGACLKVS